MNCVQHSVLTGGGLLEKCFFLNFFAQSPPLTPRMKKKIGVQSGAAEKVPENRQKVTKIEKKVGKKRKKKNFFVRSIPQVLFVIW